MAIHTIGVNDPIARKLWSKSLSKEARKATEISPLIGTGEDACIRMKTELSKEKGDRVRSMFRPQLTGDGVSENEALEGNEESAHYFTDDLVINELYHAESYKPEGTIDEQRSLVNCREQALDGLKHWWADRFSVIFHLQVAGYKGSKVTVEGEEKTVSGKWTGFNAIDAADAAHIYWPNAKTTDQALTAEDKFSLDLVDRIVTKAKTMNPKIRPFRVGGRKKYVMYLHPDQIFDLRRDSSDGEWQDFAKNVPDASTREAMIYRGALGEYNNVVFREADHVAPGYHSTSFAEIPTVRRAVLLGAGAAQIAFSKGRGPSRFFWREVEKDYGREYGIGAGSIFGMKKVRFNGKDFGTLVVPTFASVS